MRWGEKRYHSLDYYLRGLYGEKLYRISLNGGCTCPNRDGTLGDRGCIFCSAGGSGDFAASPALSISGQLAAGKALVRRKYKGSGYIAYFQAYTSTYGDPVRLEKQFRETLADPEVRILSIATRPDCLGPEILKLLAALRKEKPVWVELGLQTIHEQTAAFIRRGYALPVFVEGVKKLHALGISVIVHVILGLPGETREQMLETVEFLNTLPVDGVKLQLLHVLRGTDLGALYEEQPFPLPSREEYFRLVGDCLARLRPDIVIHRLTGDGPKALLLAPLWSADKRQVLNGLQRYLKEQDIWQGKSFSLPGYSEEKGGRYV